MSQDYLTDPERRLDRRCAAFYLKSLFQHSTYRLSPHVDLITVQCCRRSLEDSSALDVSSFFPELRTLGGADHEGKENSHLRSYGYAIVLWEMPDKGSLRDFGLVALVLMDGHVSMATPTLRVLLRY